MDGPECSGEERGPQCLSWWLERLSICLVFLTTGIGLVVQYQAFDSRSGDPDQFKAANLRQMKNKKLQELCTELKIDLSPMQAQEKAAAVDDPETQEENHDNPALEAASTRGLVMSEKVQELSNQLEKLPASACVNQHWALWLGGKGEKFIENLNAINNSAEEIAQLLSFERAHDNRKGVITELERRYMSATIAIHPMVRRLMANIRNARNDATAVVELLDGEAELDEAIVVLRKKADEDDTQKAPISERAFVFARKSFYSGKHAADVIGSKTVGGAKAAGGMLTVSCFHESFVRAPVQLLVLRCRCRPVWGSVASHGAHARHHQLRSPPHPFSLPSQHLIDDLKPKPKDPKEEGDAAGDAAEGGEPEGKHKKHKKHHKKHKKAKDEPVEQEQMENPLAATSGQGALEVESPSQSRGLSNCKPFATQASNLLRH